MVVYFEADCGNPRENEVTENEAAVIGNFEFLQGEAEYACGRIFSRYFKLIWRFKWDPQFSLSAFYCS